MPTELARMIRLQADAIDEIAARDVPAAVDVLRAARRITLIGTGTSLHAAELGALAFERAGYDARWLPASLAARWSAPPRTGDVLVIITHTAGTGFALRCRAAAIDAGVPVVSIVGRGRVDWPDAITTVDAELSHTYTVSYTAAVAVLVRLAAEVGGPDRDFAGTAAAVRAIYDDSGTGHVPLPARALAIIGSGPWGITAREGALKIREGSRVLAEGFDAERFLHGAAVPYTRADGLVLLEPSADPDGLVAALGVAAREDGMQVSTVDGDTSGLGPVLGQIPTVVRLHLLADRFAAVRGQNPDAAIVGSWAGDALWKIGSPAG